MKINVVDRLAKQLAGIKTSSTTLYVNFVKHPEYDRYTAVIKSDGYELTFPIDEEVRVQVLND